MPIISVTIGLYADNSQHSITATHAMGHWTVRCNNKIVCELEDLNISEICRLCGFSEAQIHTLLI